MLGIAILAAGKSSRMKENKLLLPLGEKLVLEHVLATLQSFEQVEKVLVAGRDAAAVTELGEAYGVETILNDQYEEGMMTSLQCAVRHFSKHSGIMFVLGDQPFLSQDSLQRLIAAHHAYPDKIIVPTFDQKRGNPVVISQSYYKDLLAASGDYGGRFLLKAYPEAVHYVPCGPELEGLDIDDPQTYELVRKVYDED